ncbi:MAG TPA: hypothetical protein VLC71_11925 [Thermomonas sp.]|nr:hypothetical protein [Thermomonas sp.]
MPIWGFFLGTVFFVVLSIEMGYLLGKIAHGRSDNEKEAPVSGVAGAVLSLTAFILALTFAMAADRYSARKELVREDANAIRTAYLRSDFLPQADRVESKALFKAYVDRRLAFAQQSSSERPPIGPLLAEADQVQRRLWTIAVANAERDMNSDVAALYIESLNGMFEVHATRLAIGVRARIPLGIWVVLCGLTLLGMISMGYHSGIAGSSRSKARWILATSFGLVIALIASLDRPSDFLLVTQQPLADLQALIQADK